MQRMLKSGIVLVLLFAWSATAQELVLGGDPLRVGVEADGIIGIQRLEDQALVPQYYAVRAKGSVLFLSEGEGFARWGNGTSTFALWDDPVADRLTPVTHVRVDDRTIRTRLAAGPVLVDQTVDYVDGNPYCLYTWVVSNASEIAFRDLRFVHGGDVAPGGEDAGRGAWDEGSNLVSVAAGSGDTNNWMSLRGEPGSPATGHYEAHFQLVREACKTGPLPDTVDLTSHDAAYALQWDRATLAPGEAWTIRAREQWPGAAAPPPVHRDVTALMEPPLFTWQISYQTGTYFGQLTLSNPDGPACSGPFWCVMASSADQRFMHPTGTLPDERTYLDITAEVEQLLGDGELGPGDEITVPGIEVYMRSRQPPPAGAFSVWATAPES